ncbi:hypothetical protein LTR64_001531 [Lithohypha guttulata]|uniref:uncharacterized protein n=1 Tax=Lithohypha guttulata TaxID=1690604 RepID=UPI002DDDFF6C|nr:hypothetical protein LTR51_003724 [Lithohypha guttulata]
MSIDTENRETFVIRSLMQDLTIDDDSPKPTSMLLVIPHEIRNVIYSHMHDDDLVADVTMTPPRSRRGRTMRFQHLYPRLIRSFESLLSMPELEEEVHEYIAKNVVFQGQHSSSFIDMPAVFGAESCMLIHRFEMRVEFQFKLKHQGQWPEFLKCFVEDLPNLEWVKLYSKWSDRSQPHPENESQDPAGLMTRYDQNTRSSFRFLCWLNKRHPNFQTSGRLILPAQTGGRFGQHEVYSHHLILEVSKERRRWESRTELVGAEPADYEEDARALQTVYDEVLNTKLGRRAKWTQWHNNGLKLEDFIIVPAAGQTRSSIITSEVGNEDDEYFLRLDQRGYQPFELFQERGWLNDGPVNVEKLIDQANRQKQSVANRARRGAGTTSGTTGANAVGRDGMNRGGMGRGGGRRRGRGGPSGGQAPVQARGGFRGNGRGIPGGQGGARGNARGQGRD